MPGMVREYTGGNSRGPGWREFAGIFGCAVGSSVADGAVRPGVEWLAVGPGATELGFPGPALGKMQGEAAGRAGDSSGEGEEPPPEGLGGHHLLTQTGPRCPTGQVMRHHLYRQPGGVGGETARRHVVQPHAVLQVSNGVLDLGMRRWSASSSRVSPSRSVMKVVIAVGGEEGQLGTGSGLHPPDNEPHRCGVGLTLEGDVEPVPINKA